MKTKLQSKFLSAFERHEISCAEFAADGWTLGTGPGGSYRWTKGNKQVRAQAHGWVLVASDTLESVRPSDIRAGKFVVAQTGGEPQELIEKNK